MSEEQGLSKVKKTVLGIAAVAAATTTIWATFFDGARTVIAVVDTPARLTAHEAEAAERMAEFERMMEAARLRFCEELGMFPSECPEFTVDHAP